MDGVKRWRDSDHLDRAVETAGGREAFDAAVGEMLDQARGWRLAELRNRREMTQEQRCAGAAPPGEWFEPSVVAEILHCP
jgi:hypothetical protein